MNCICCKVGDLKNGFGTFVSECESGQVVVTGVPALVCSNCGEEYFEGCLTADLIRQAEEVQQSGLMQATISYVAA